jgi:indolepyruvate ferredoxin oxidoreductase
MSRAPATLEDKYDLQQRHIFLSGTQALVRLPLMQAQRDRLAGLDTAGYISGYRGSPLGAYDRELWRNRQLLAAQQIHFEPGLNEDLAATAVWGTQQVNLYGTGKVAGVFTIWYGKGPGADRSTDVFKHGNSAGSAEHGGVLVVCGDDHGCQSSTLPHQSEPLLRAAMIPVLSPSDVQEYLQYGLLGIALSRYSGCWVGFKATTEIVESSATLDVGNEPLRIVTPEDFAMPPGGLNIRWPDPPLDQEARLFGPKMAAVAAFARANRFDRLTVASPQRRLGIVTSGKAHTDLLQAFQELGLNASQLAALGIAVYKVGMPWPLEPVGIRAFAEGFAEVLVIEEKASLIEEQLANVLYHSAAARRPRLVGKRDEQGRELLPSHGELDPVRLARLIVARLAKLPGGGTDLTDRLRSLPPAPASALANDIARAPFFCSGCPHNTSTSVPEGSRAVAGIGCHSMALAVPTRHTSTYTQMGGEGANWIGQARFVEDRHVFQNLGDGTYSHSGLLAIRAAANAGVNITYKILFNDAVAMTGGQPLEGNLTVADIARQVVAAGAKQVVVVADDPARHSPHTLPAGVTLHHRSELDLLQRRLREIQGLTALIYDQTCAAEKRRRWKRGLIPAPTARVFINESVCEGCGDCSVKSNCISVKPLETQLGRKRRIDQSSCNVDLSCLKGFCPSFVVVRGGKLRSSPTASAQGRASPFDSLPLPQPGPLPCSIMVTGIGGTGVITIGALMGMAAHLENKHCSVLDFTGLAQKNGAVMSHIRIADTADEVGTTRIPPGGADLLIACDMVVAASPNALSRVRRDSTTAIVNVDVEPTSGFVLNTDIDFQLDRMQQTIHSATGEQRAEFVSATTLATALCGDAIAANLFLVGYALQKGLIPLPIAALLRAIELNGVAVDMNKQALNWGRLLAHDPAEVARRAQRPVGDQAPASLPELVKRYTALLVSYQNARYAKTFTSIVERVAAAETHQAPGCKGLAETIATSLFKLMTYKDEYEVARLYSDGAFQRRLQAQFEGNYELEFHLAAPLFARIDPTTGEPAKSAYGAWTMRLFKVLAGLKSLRGTWLDPFGYTRERRSERDLIDEYWNTIDELLGSLTAANHSLAVSIAALPQSFRGFGHVKWRNVQTGRQRHDEMIRQFRGTASCPSSPSTTVTGRSGSTGA